jgi:hypothetical protein
MRRAFAWAFIAVLLCAGPAVAQDAEKKANFNLGGGYTFALSQVGQSLGNGYNFTVGAWFSIVPALAVGADYSFNGLGQKQVDFSVSDIPAGAAVKHPFYADMNMQYGDFNLILRPKRSGALRPFLVAGIGVYYRPVKVTTPAVGYIPGFCDPFWYYCQPGGFVPVEAVVGKRSSTDFGVDVGGGVNLRVGTSTSIYFEARYHYIWGPNFTSTSNTIYKANGQFLPITFGVRF